MNAAQILMMPMASATNATTLSSDAGAAQTSGELSALFSDLLAQTAVTQAAAQQIPELDMAKDVPDSSLLTSKMLLGQDQEFVRLLEQTEPPETEYSSTLQTAAAYVQLAAVQVPPLPPSPLEQERSADLAADAPSAIVDVVAGSGQSTESELPGVQQGSTLLSTATNDVLPRQLQEQELSGQVGVMQQKHLKTIEMTDKHEDKVTQAENRTQSLEQVVVENPVRKQEASAPLRLTEHQQQPLVPQAGDNRNNGQQPQVQQSGSGRGQEQHQHAVAQAHIVRPDGSQDGAISNKPSATVQAQAFRFAQSNEVAVAAVDTGRQGRDFSGQQQSQTFQQSSMPMLETTEETPVASAVPALHGQTATDQHQMTFLSGSRTHLAVAAVATADELPKQVQGEQVARQVFERLGAHEFKQGSDQISLRLSPEHLGAVQLNLRMEEQGLKLEIITEQRGVREALLRQGDELKETLARQNIRIDSFDVSTGNLGGQSQQREWRQMNPEQRMYHAQYASAARGGAVVQDSLQGVQYFAPQYQSTIDVRF